MTRPEYTKLELRVMELMAHGKTRREIADTVWMNRRGPGATEPATISLSTVARIARDATDKAVGLNAPIIQGIATMVAEGSISVPFRGQKATAEETALFWLETRVMSALDWREVQEIRNTYTAMKLKAGVE